MCHPSTVSKYVYTIECFILYNEKDDNNFGDDQTTDIPTLTYHLTSNWSMIPVLVCQNSRTEPSHKEVRDLQIDRKNEHTSLFNTTIVLEDGLRRVETMMGFYLF